MHGDAKHALQSSQGWNNICGLVPDDWGLPMTVQGRGRARGYTPFSVRGKTMRTLLGNCHGREQRVSISAVHA
jgi:hypothetical protein